MKTAFELFMKSFFLMAFTCDNEIESTLVYNTFKTSVTPQANFSLNDTIWVTGITSSKVYNLMTNDSVFYTEQSRRDELLVMKLINTNPTILPIFFNLFIAFNFYIS